MNKLDELIAALCPDGIDIKKVGDICDTITDYTAAGSFADIAKNVKYINDGVGYAQLIRTTDLKSAFKNIDKFIYVDEHAFNYLWRVNLDSECLVLPNVGNCGEVYYVTPDILPFSHNVLGPNSILVKSSIIDNRYLFHAFQSEKFQKKLAKITSTTGQTKFNKTNFKALSLPVPPLEVQREIVRVLDSFTLLTAELTAELTARKKQYEFYRDKLLSHDGNYLVKSLAELGEWSGGKTPSMSEKSFWEQGTIPWISSKDMKSSTLIETKDHITEKAVKEASMTVYPANSIAIVTRSGILKHTFPVAYVPFETTINQDIKMLVVNEGILPRYAFHVIQGKGNDILIKTKKQGGTVDSLDFQKVLAYKVPVPSKDIQSRVVELLDNFESICTDLNIGLPAEIEARQKQYEYYRELLLTFAETGSTIMTDRQTDRQTGRQDNSVFFWYDLIVYGTFWLCVSA